MPWHAIPACPPRPSATLRRSASARTGTGYRDYSEQDLQHLRFVARARSLGFSIEDCRGLLDLYRDQHRASADVRELALARIAEIERKIEELSGMKATLAELVARCQGDARPDCPILRDLAEPGCCHPA